MAVVEVFLPAMAIMFIPTEDPIRTMSENMRSIIPGAAEDLEVAVVAVALVPVLALAQAAAEPVAAKRTPSAQRNRVILLRKSCHSEEPQGDEESP